MSILLFRLKISSPVSSFLSSPSFNRQSSRFYFGKRNIVFIVFITLLTLLQIYVILSKKNSLRFISVRINNVSKWYLLDIISDVSLQISVWKCAMSLFHNLFILFRQPHSNSYYSFPLLFKFYNSFYFFLNLKSHYPIITIFWILVFTKFRVCAKRLSLMVLNLLKLITEFLVKTRIKASLTDEISLKKCCVPWMRRFLKSNLENSRHFA